jgi:F like protein
MADPRAAARWRRDAALARSEKRVLAAIREALGILADYTRHTLAQSGLDDYVLDDRAPAWRAALSGEVTPAIYDAFTAAWELLDRGTGIDPTLHGTQYLEGVWNRLVGASDEVFDRVRGAIEAGRQEGLHPSVVAKDVDAMLSDTANWEGRARTIARTETLGANNAGARASAKATAEYLGYSTDDVMRVWLATGDDRTRETHQEADGQTIYGLDATYQVGSSDLAGPGDPEGDPEEVINCRCTEQIWYPGDPEYVITAGGAMPTTGQISALFAAVASDDDEPTGVIVCALPAETDPVHGIGDEDKHATILFYGDLDDLPDGYLATLQSIVGQYAATQAPIIEQVEGVESLGGDGARVWMLDPDGRLAYVHGDLPDYDSEAVPPDHVDQYPTYTPHVTIGYPETDEADDSAAADDVTVDAGPLDDATEQAAANVTRITFDRLAVWAGPEQTEYPLTGDAGDDTEETAMSRTASATRETRGQTVDRLVASGFFPTRAHAAQSLLDRPLTAAAGDAAPVPVETDEGTLAVGDEAPAVDEAILDPFGPNPDRFHGIALVEDEETGDRRVFAPGAVYWDEAGLPMPFGWQVQDAPGHDNAIICGRIDSFERVGNAITYTGTWDLDGAGWETRRLVGGQFLRGISVDTDDFDVVIVNPDGTPVDPFDMMLGDTETEPVMLVEKSRLRSATACRVPAFAPSGTVGAYIANGLPEDLQAAVDAGMDGEPAPEEAAAVAAIVAAGASYTRATRITERPPAAWYTAPDLDHPTPITISDTGRIFGHLAAWGTCHIGIQGTCVTPPHSITDYAHFAHGITDTDGGPIITGLLTMDTGHAAPDLRALPAAAHYDDTGTQFGTVAVGEDDLGIWIAGSVLPEATAAQIAKVNRAGALSGDWRRIRGNLELVAALAVNTPGFPIPRLSMAASAAEGQLSLVAAGIVTREVEAGSMFAAGDMTEAEFRAMVASAVDLTLANRDAEAARRGRIERASRTLRTSRATAAAARIGG